MTKQIFALLYDFDKTLCTKDMQEYSFIPSLGMKPKDFWQACGNRATKEHMDNILSYMYTMLELSKKNNKSITRQEFVNHGKTIELFPGVQQWFKNINEIGNENNVQIEHYIVSSGLKEIIEGSEIKDEFKEIYACEFLYDENNEAIWPKLVVNYTTKTQFLFRISKGALNIENDIDVNKYTDPNNFRIPFTNMLYIGDGLTDVPCMKLVKKNHGHSIAVYNKEENEVVKDLLLHNRVDYTFEANYNKDTPLYNTVKELIEGVNR